MNYRVRQNDTPGEIARRMTGNPANAAMLVIVNHRRGTTIIRDQVAFQKPLYAGEILQLPHGWQWHPIKRNNNMSLSGLGRTGLGDLISDAQSAAQDVADYIAANGCDCSANLCAFTTTFQKAYNAAYDAQMQAEPASGTQILKGPRLGVDGKYGTGTYNALVEVKGGGPNPCWSTGPCKGLPCGAMPGPAPAPAPSPAPSPGPTPQPGPTPGAASSSNTGLILAGLAALGVAGGYYYMKKHPQTMQRLKSKMSRGHARLRRA